MPFTQNNQLIVSDWTPNLHRIVEIVKALDIPSENPTPSEPPPAALAEPNADKESAPEPALIPALPKMKVAPKKK